MEVEGVRFSSTRLREMTGWKPQHDFDAGLRRVRAVLERGERMEKR